MSVGIEESYVIATEAASVGDVLMALVREAYNVQEILIVA